ncbi:MAG: sensor histidine kinase [Anaerolineae bacterium]
MAEKFWGWALPTGRHWSARPVAGTFDPGNPGSSDSVRHGPPIRVPRLGEILVRMGHLSQERLEEALRIQAELAQQGMERRIGQVLLDLGYIQPEHLELVVAEQQRWQEQLEAYNRQLEQEVATRTAELQKALAELQELDQMKANFLATISHELRTPLSYITGYIPMVLEEELGPLTAAQKQALKSAMAGAHRLTRLINDLLDFVSLDQRKLALFFEQVDIRDLIAEAVALCQEAADSRKVLLRTQVAEDVPPVLVDRHSMGRALFHLVDNAVKFTPPGGWVEVRAFRTEDGTRVRLEVQDTGIGIDPAHQERIFERFYQVDTSSTRRYGGTGLGLALVKLVVEAHHSQIKVESAPGKGAKFYCDLPTA